MKYFIIALLLLPVTVFSQASWNGQWKTNIKKLDIYLLISEEGKKVELTIPMQGLANMEADNSEITGDRLDFFFRALGVTFYGNMKGQDSISGTLNQGGAEYDMDFVRSNDDLSFKRPQTPKEPFPYAEETVVIKKTENSARIAGTLTKPEGNGPFPAVILISGSGPQNRDSEIFKHKPFLVLADYFTRNGYAVLRYDDRGIGLSGGKFKGTTSEDFSYDTEAVFKYLQSREDIKKDQIGLVGHSEGGLIAPMVASRNSDVAFLVLLAGPGIPSKDIMQYQLTHQFNKLDLSKDGKKKMESFVQDMVTILASDEANDKVIEKFRVRSDAFYGGLPLDDQKLFGVSKEAFYFSMASSFFDPWMRSFLQYDPRPTLQKVKIPVLAINGKKDRQVTAKKNIKGIKKALKSSGNKQVKTKYFRKLNHLFQESVTGEGSEYMSIQETFNEEAMAYVVKWMNNTTQK